MRASTKSIFTKYFRHKEHMRKKKQKKQIHTILLHILHFQPGSFTATLIYIILHHPPTPTPSHTEAPLTLLLGDVGDVVHGEVMRRARVEGQILHRVVVQRHTHMQHLDLILLGSGLEH